MIEDQNGVNWYRGKTNMLFWNPKPNIVYRCKRDVSHRQNPKSIWATNQDIGTITDVFLLKGENACYCSYKINSDYVEVRIKSAYGKLTRRKSGNDVTISGKYYSNDIENTLSDYPSRLKTIKKIFFTKDKVKFSKYRSSVVSDSSPGGYDYRVFTYLVQVIPN